MKRALIIGICIFLAIMAQRGKTGAAIAVAGLSAIACLAIRDDDRDRDIPTWIK